MGEYLRQKLQKENLLLIVQKCKEALNKGFLTDSQWEKNQIERVRRCRNFTWFCRNRKKSQQEYDVFCSFLEKKLPLIEKNKNPLQKLSQLVSPFKKVLKIDGRRRAFDYTFNLGENILEFYAQQLKDFLKEKICKNNEVLENWFMNLINISPYESYVYLEIKEILKFLIKFPNLLLIPNKKFILDQLIKLRKNRRPNQFLNYLLQNYGRGETNSLANKLTLYINQYRGLEKDTLQKLRERKQEIDKNKQKTMEQIESLLSQKDKAKFKTLVKRITYLIYINEYEDPLRNNNMDGLADYFLRKNVTLCLYQLKKIKSPEPMDYPQRYLLRLAQKNN